MKSRLLLHAVLIWAAITLAADTSFACSCGGKPPVLDAYDRATEDLLYLDNMEKYRGQTRVSGNYHGGFNAVLHDFANRTIRIRGEQKTYE